LRQRLRPGRLVHARSRKGPDTSARRQQRDTGVEGAAGLDGGTRRNHRAPAERPAGPHGTGRSARRDPRPEGPTPEGATRHRPHAQRDHTAPATRPEGTTRDRPNAEGPHARRDQTPGGTKRHRPKRRRRQRAAEWRQRRDTRGGAAWPPRPTGDPLRHWGQPSLRPDNEFLLLSSGITPRRRKVDGCTRYGVYSHPL
jgi:hypothetical protein